MLDMPAQDYATGIINDKETNYEPDTSTRQQLTLTRFDGDIPSVRLP
jgi:hypothetical protein